MKAIADVYTECQLDKAERFRKKFVTGLAPRSRKKLKDKQVKMKTRSKKSLNSFKSMKYLNKNTRTLIIQYNIIPIIQQQK